VRANGVRVFRVRRPTPGFSPIGRTACFGIEGFGSRVWSDGMEHEGEMRGRRSAGAAPLHVLSGPALLAVRASEEARGIRGLDVLRRSVDRAPPALS
ncbi:MAG TPA: hypothetical protein VFQ01_03240, partial [Nocardioides sp.]|nr:hypothetical protein [Nocardioides sp.]